MKVYVNGRWVSDKKPAIFVDDHGFLYGDGVYETLRVYKGRAFHLRDHMKRLMVSARGIGLKHISVQKVAAAIEATPRRNGHREAVVRVTITRGPGAYGFDPRLCPKPTIVISSKAFKPYPSHFHSKGIRVAVVSLRRNDPLATPPWIKSTSCLNGVLAKAESIKARAVEGLLLGRDEKLTEGTVSNIFLVKGGKILTPKLDGQLLSGVTRKVVIGLAKDARKTVFEKELRFKDLISADELFLTNTTLEVLPISSVVRKGKVKKFAVGPVTRDLMRRFKSAIVS